MKRILFGVIVPSILSCLLGSLGMAAELNREALRGASVESRGRLKIIRLEGTPYDMGYQHGFLLQEEVKANVNSTLSCLASRFKIPWVGRLIANRLLDKSYSQMRPFIPRDYREELRGLAEGSGVDLRDLQRVHALLERDLLLGSSLVAYGEATKDGKLLQTRNLDWDLRTGIQRHPVLFVVRPANKLPFVNLGFAGFIGVLSGLNRQGISVAQMGAKSADQTLEGIPMPFLLRRILEESDGLDVAVVIVNKAPRTGGHNYLFADAVKQKTTALEATQKLLAVFYREDHPPLPEYAVPLKEAMVRSEVAFDPLVREQQTCSRGNPKRPGLEPPGGHAYEVGYRRQALMVQNNYGGITPEVAQLIAREAAPSTNLQSVLYAYPEVWVAYAEGETPAARTRFWHFHLDEFF